MAKIKSYILLMFLMFSIFSLNTEEIELKIYKIIYRGNERQEIDVGSIIHSDGSSNIIALNYIVKPDDKIILNDNELEVFFSYKENIFYSTIKDKGEYILKDNEFIQINGKMFIEILSGFFDFFKVTNGRAIIGHQGTSYYVETASDKTIVYVKEGSVIILVGDNFIKVEAGEGKKEINGKFFNISTEYKKEIQSEFNKYIVKEEKTESYKFAIIFEEKITVVSTETHIIKAETYTESSFHNLEEMSRCIERLKKEGIKDFNTKSYIDCMNLGEIFLNKGGIDNYNQSLNYYTKAEKIANNNKDRLCARTSMAACHYKLKEIDKAISILENVIEEDKNIYNALKQLYVLYNEKMLNNGYFDPEIRRKQNKVFNLISFAQYSEAKEVYEKGKSYYDKCNYQKALPFLEKAIKLNRENGNYFFYTGMCYKYLAEWNNALHYLKESNYIYEKSGKQYDLALSYKVIGDLFKNQGNYKEALDYMYKAEKICNKIKNDNLLGCIWISLGNVFYSKKDYNSSMNYYKKAYEINKKEGDKAIEASSLNNIGLIYENNGKNEIALTYYKEALQIYEKLNEKSNKGRTLRNIGNIYYHQGKYLDALNYYKDALQVFMEIGNKYLEGSALLNIGNVFYCQEKYDFALTVYYEKVLKISQEFGFKDLEVPTLRNIGLVYEYKEENNIAIANYEKAFLISKKLGYKDFEARLIKDIKITYENNKNNNITLESYEKTLKLCKEFGEESLEAKLLNDVGSLYEKKGKKEISLIYYEKAFQIYKKLKENTNIGITLRNIACIYNDLGDYDHALKYFEEVLKISKKSGYKFLEGKTLIDIGVIYDIKGKYSISLKYYEKAKKLDPDSSSFWISIFNTGCIYFNKGNYKKAMEYFEKAKIKFEKNDDNWAMPYYFLNIGQICFYQDQLDIAKKFFFDGQEEALKFKNDDMLSAFYFYFTMINLKQNNIAQAKFNLNKFQEKQEKINSIDKLKEFYYLSAEYNYAIANYIKAEDYIKKSLELIKKMKIEGAFFSALIQETAAKINVKLKKYKEARIYYQKAIDILKGSGNFLYKRIEKSLEEMEII